MLTVNSFRTFLLIERNQKQNPKNSFSKHFKDSVETVEMEKTDNSAFDYWRSVKDIIERVKHDKEIDKIIICHGNSECAPTFSPEILNKTVDHAYLRGAEILCGEVGWYRNAVAVSDNMYWIDEFSDLRFVVLFRRIFDKITDEGITDSELNDNFFSRIFERKFLAFPFLSVPIGLPPLEKIVDTPRSKQIDLFRITSKRLDLLNKIKIFFKDDITPVNFDLSASPLPTYILNLPERTDRRKSIEKEFSGRTEFDLRFTDAIKHEIGAVGLWLSIRNIITSALARNEEIIIICEDDHYFTQDYSRASLYENINVAKQKGTELLMGGIGGFGTSIQISKNQFWINWFYCTQFIVVYRPAFQKILDAEFDKCVTADGILSKIILNKLVCYPFISKQKDFGYSDVTITNNNKGYIELLFEMAEKRLSIYDHISGGYVVPANDLLQ